jgi:hypothetical protein
MIESTLSIVGLVDVEGEAPLKVIWIDIASVQHWRHAVESVTRLLSFTIGSSSFKFRAFITMSNGREWWITLCSMNENELILSAGSAGSTDIENGSIEEIKLEWTADSFRAAEMAVYDSMGHIVQDIIVEFARDGREKKSLLMDICCSSCLCLAERMGCKVSLFVQKAHEGRTEGDGLVDIRCRYEQCE